jgi:hypothetical protein
MKALRKSDLDFEGISGSGRGPTGGMPSGWWILPSVILGLFGWIAIFYSVGLL